MNELEGNRKELVKEISLVECDAPIHGLKGYTEIYVEWNPRYGLAKKMPSDEHVEALKRHAETGCTQDPEVTGPIN